MKIDSTHLASFKQSLKMEEKSLNTIRAYAMSCQKLIDFCEGADITKEMVIDLKNIFVSQYSIPSCNRYLIAINRFLKYLGLDDCCVKTFRYQSNAFFAEEKELTIEEYNKLVNAAYEMEDKRIPLAIQTIAATGIRISELQFITIEAAKIGRATIRNKGKTRTILIPKSLQALLLLFCKNQEIKNGPIFVTYNGTPMDRIALWKGMKVAARRSDVSENKVYPHNLRHLFARTFYALDKDAIRLADLLGHASVDTTRIYTMISGAELRDEIDKLGLVVSEAI